MSPPHDSKPCIASTESKPHNRSHTVISQFPRANEVKASLLTLPPELRLQIYDYLLVSRYDRMRNPSWAVGDTNQKLIVLAIIPVRQGRTMEPAILQTCKEIYREGNSILYAKNVFAISKPEQMFKLSAQIGLANSKLIRTLHLRVPYMTKLLPWLQLLSMVAGQAGGLRHLELHWGVSIEFTWDTPRGARERGWGDSLDFVRALGRIEGLERLVIKGYYAKNWQVYLSERLGIQVHAICGDCVEECRMTERDLSEEEVENRKFIRENNDRELRAFREYQRGTEDLIP